MFFRSRFAGHSRRLSSVTASSFYVLAPELLLFHDPFKRFSSRLDGFPWMPSHDIESIRPGGVFLDMQSAIPKSEYPAVAVGTHTACNRSTAIHMACSQVARGIMKAEELRLKEETRDSASTPSRSSSQEDAWIAAEFLAEHAQRIDTMVRSVGCHTLVRKALQRLDTLTHVFFLEASKFSLGHVQDMASAGESEEFMPYVNQASHGGVFDELSAYPYNRCSLQFYGQAFARLSSSAAFFDALRDMDMLVHKHGWMRLPDSWRR